MSRPVIRDECDDIAAILHPAPAPLRPDADTAQHEAFRDALAAMRRSRASTAEQLRANRDAAHLDPVLSALRAEAQAKASAERRIRELIAYAREFTGPHGRGYTLDALAGAVGTSYSTVRGAFDQHDVEAVAEATGRRHTLHQEPAGDAALAQLVDELAERTTPLARAFVAAVAAVLRRQGWTPYPPVARSPNPRTAKRYIRWERHWPNGTKVGLYQEPTGVLSTHTRMPNTDARYFYIENDDAGGVAELEAELVEYAERVTKYDAEQS